MASNTDRFMKVIVAPATELALPISQDSTIINLTNIDGWESDTAVAVVIDRIDNGGNITEDLKEVVIGTIGPNGLENVIRGVGGTRQNHAGGAIVEPTIASSEQWNRMINGLTGALGSDGKIKETAFNKDSEGKYDKVVPGGAVVDGSIKPEKITFASYSTSEQRVGTWIDGKPIYRRVIAGTVTASANTIVLTNFSSISYSTVDNILSATGYWHKNSEEQVIIGSYWTGNYSAVVKNNTLKLIRLLTQSDASRTDAPYAIILEYTKTTD